MWETIQVLMWNHQPQLLRYLLLQETKITTKGKEKPTCNHCGMMGHTVEKNSTSASTSFTFTQEQCQLFLAMLGNQIQSSNFAFTNNETHMTNNVIQLAAHSTSIAGNFSSLQNFHSPDFSCDLRHSIFSEKRKRKKEVVSRHAYGGDTWVVDTGATNNIVHSVTLLTTITLVKHCVVELPNGEIALVTLIGSVRISVHLFLEMSCVCLHFPSIYYILFSLLKNSYVVLSNYHIFASYRTLYAGGRLMWVRFIMDST